MGVVAATVAISPMFCINWRLDGSSGALGAISGAGPCGSAGRLGIPSDATGGTVPRALSSR